jgi:hypothetical protein
VIDKWVQPDFLHRTLENIYLLMLVLSNLVIILTSKLGQLSFHWEGDEEMETWRSDHLIAS